MNIKINSLTDINFQEFDLYYDIVYKYFSSRKLITPPVKHYKIIELDRSFNELLKYLKPINSLSSRIEICDDKIVDDLKKSNVLYKYNNNIYLFNVCFRDSDGYTTIPKVYILLKSKNNDLTIHLNKFLDEMIDKYYNDKFKNVKKDPKKMDRVFLPSGQKEDIINEIEAFLKGHHIYHKELNLSWKKGIIFYGKPGNGKTLLINAISKYFGLESKNFSDYINRSGEITYNFHKHDEVEYAKFMDLDSLLYLKYPEAKLPVLMYIEDLDKLIPSSEGTFKMSLTNLLNTLDGADNITDCIFIATTNYMDDLSDSLKYRPGRFESLYEIKQSSEGIKGLLEYHNIKIKDGSLDDIVDKLKDYSMAYTEDFIVRLKVKYNKSEFTMAEINPILEILYHNTKKMPKEGEGTFFKIKPKPRFKFEDFNDEND